MATSVVFGQSGSLRSNNPAAFVVPWPSMVRTQSGDICVLTVLYKPTTNGVGTVDTPAGWTVLGNTGFQGSGAANASDTGDSIIYQWWKEVDGTETGNVTVTFSEGTIGIASGYITTHSGVGQGDWDLEFGYAGTSTAAASQSVALDSTMSFAPGDLVWLWHCTPTDIQATPFSNQAITATGVTFGTMTEFIDSAATTGTDSTVMAAYWPVTAGTATVTPTVSFDIAGTNTNQLGPISVLRLRKKESSTADEVQVVAGAAVFSETANTDSTPVAPAHIADDVLIAFAYQRANNSAMTATSTTGWTALANIGPTNGGKFLAYYKVATGAGETIPGFRSTSAAVYGAAVLRLRGADTAALVDVAAAGEAFAAGVAGNEHAAITTVTNNATVLFFPMFENDPWYVIRETGWDRVLHETTLLGLDLNMQVFEKILPTAGSTGAITMLQESNNIATGFSFAVNRATANDVQGSGTAQLSLGSTGAASTAFESSGTAALGLGSTGAASTAFEQSGSAQLGLGSTGAGTHAREQSGSAQLGLGTTGAATIAVSNSGSAQLGLSASGAGSASYPPNGAGTATLDLSASGAATIAVSAGATAALELAASGAGTTGRQIDYSGWYSQPADAWSASSGSAWAERDDSAWDQTTDQNWRSE